MTYGISNAANLHFFYKLLYGKTNRYLRSVQPTLLQYMNGL